MFLLLTVVGPHGCGVISRVFLLRLGLPRALRKKEVLQLHGKRLSIDSYRTMGKVEDKSFSVLGRESIVVGAKECLIHRARCPSLRVDAKQAYFGVVR